MCVYMHTGTHAHTSIHVFYLMRHYHQTFLTETWTFVVVLGQHFIFLQCWGLNRGPRACSAGTLPCELCSQTFENILNSDLPFKYSIWSLSWEVSVACFVVREWVEHVCSY